MKIRVTKRDVIWGYFSIFFQTASGVIVLPFILSMLSSEEVGFNYLMLTVGTIVSLFDVSFSPMFGRNISYLFSGVQVLKKEGVIECDSDTVNYHLVATMLGVAKLVYRRISVTALILLLTVGTVYIYKVTDGFTNVDNALFLWIIFSLSSFFNIYFAYFNALLTGSGQIKEEKKAILSSRIAYIILSISLLYCGLGLMSVCLANLISPFLGRYISYRYFFTQDLLDHIKGEQITKAEIIDTFKILWFNTRKLCISTIGSYCINNFGMFLAGIFLSLKEVASYGLMVQACGIVLSLSQNYYLSKQPELAAYRVQGDIKTFADIFSFSIIFFWFTNIIGFLAVTFIGPEILSLLKSNTHLPQQGLMLLYGVVLLLEANHSLCSLTVIVGNRIPPIAASLVPGFFIALINYLFFKFTNLGIWGLVIAPGICQAAYNNWKWPKEAMKDLKITPAYVVHSGLGQIKDRIVIYGRLIFSKL